jgi:hypothetical protein
MGWQGYAVLALISNGNAGNQVLASGNADQDTQGTLKTLATNLNGGDSGIMAEREGFDALSSQTTYFSNCCNYLQTMQLLAISSTSTDSALKFTLFLGK